LLLKGSRDEETVQISGQEFGNEVATTLVNEAGVGRIALPHISSRGEMNISLSEMTWQRLASLGSGAEYA
jgi:hypothetical protein